MLLRSCLRHAPLRYFPPRRSHVGRVGLLGLTIARGWPVCCRDFGRTAFGEESS